MNTKIKPLCFLLVLFAGCTSHEKSGAVRFTGFQERFLDALWTLQPSWASSQGYHKHDSLMTIPESTFRTRELKFIAEWSDSLKRFDGAKLSPAELTDKETIAGQLEALKWYNTDFKLYEWDPSSFNAGEGFALLLSENYAPLDERLRRVGKRLRFVAPYYAAAKASLRQPTMEHTDLGISQNQGALDVFQTMLPDSLNKSGLSAAEKAAIAASAQKAAGSVKEYIDWLARDVRPRLEKSGARSFRIGRKLYAEKFQHDIASRLTAEETYEKALQRKAEVQKEMAKLALGLYPKLYPGIPAPADTLRMVQDVINALSMKHAHRDSFKQEIERQLPQLSRFVNEKKLLYLDPTKPLVVRETPKYLQGIAGASISAPGPYDKKGNTYYNVTPLTSYDPAGAESFLREYNSYVLQILNIHEAIPGHYVQLVYSNSSPSLVKSVFGNGATVEGWAVYGERMMLENGYGGNTPEMWLMYYKWHLRAICNTILDYSVHNLDMTEAQALDLLQREAFQQEAEAKGKWRRVSLTQVQLCSYFSGYQDIYELREEIKKKEGKAFSLNSFHEKFLSFGSAPVKTIRALLLGESKGAGLP